LSCPHPRGPVERIVGSFSELVCPDCHARLASIEEVLPEVSVTNVDSDVCGEASPVDADYACGLEPDHYGDHDFYLFAPGGGEYEQELDKPNHVPGEYAMSPDEIQAVYDEAHVAGILEELTTYDPASGVTSARIENGNLIETVAPAE
jgi:hypothetical protein